jgi:hypothetical protein
MGVAVQNQIGPISIIATPEVIGQNYPAVNVFPHVIEVNGDVCQAVMNLSALRAMHNIDTALTEDEAIAAIETIINTPGPEPEPTAEERIAAAMEYQNLTTL